VGEPLKQRYAASFGWANRLIIPNVKVRDLIKLLSEDGWYLARTKGSHRQFKHQEKSGTVTVAGNGSIDVPRGTLNSILKHAGLKPERGTQE
jgi:predicted RNA binding protein YcfA (HicA-like mRNA interferase family)